MSRLMNEDERAMRRRLDIIMMLTRDNLTNAKSQLKLASEKLKVASEDEHKFEQECFIDIFPDHDALAIVEVLDEIVRNVEGQLEELDALKSKMMKGVI